jgi:hypothetical protein
MRGAGVACSGQRALYLAPDLIGDRAKPVRAVLKFLAPIELLAAVARGCGLSALGQPRGAAAGRGRAGMNSARRAGSLRRPSSDPPAVRRSGHGSWGRQAASQIRTELAQAGPGRPNALRGSTRPPLRSLRGSGTYSLRRPGDRLARQERSDCELALGVVCERLPALLCASDLAYPHHMKGRLIIIGSVEQSVSGVSPW